MQIRVAPEGLNDWSAEERQARVDLAAAHRLAHMHGFSEGIFNHLTLVVPGRSDRYYQIPFGLHWSEVTASCLMEIGYDGEVLSGEGEVERPGEVAQPHRGAADGGGEGRHGALGDLPPARLAERNM